MNNTITKLSIALTLSAGLFFAQSCVQDDDYATPPIECNIPTANITLSELISKIKAGTINLDSAGKINEDLYVRGYVITSDETGNIYKTVSLQDKVENPTAGLQIEINESNLYNAYPKGAQVQINLKGLAIARESNQGVYKIGLPTTGTYAVDQIPSADRAAFMVKTCEPIQIIKPKVVTSITDALKEENLNTLVTIQGVQFSQPEVDKTYAEKNSTKNRELIDKKGKPTILRNSGYATWFADALPTKSGSITVLVSKFGSTWQLYINDTNDVKFDQDRFTVIPEGVEEIKGTKEGFESAKKNNYSTADLTLSTGIWSFSEGGVFDPSDSDLKNSGTASVRLRGSSATEGYVQSKFFVTGLKTLKVYFGGSTFSESTDADKEIKLEVLISIDFGETWKSVGEKTSVRGTLNLLEFPINAASNANVSVKLVNKSFLRSTGNRLRVNIDDVEFVK
jgi:hypothetical protein